MIVARQIIWLVCDYCQSHPSDAVDDGGFPTVHALRRNARSYGWVTRRISGCVRDFCCAECERDFRSGKTHKVSLRPGGEG